ncbi:Ankyrin repeat family protein [Abeliophyllum distichum]|uniref:Ankyrin repeat family protein n=1 Tax=Abeliophyllum distichum TaxID=126358 RepID=A0ABD1UID4_9LAMI
MHVVFDETNSIEQEKASDDEDLKIPFEKLNVQNQDKGNSNNIEIQHEEETSTPQNEEESHESINTSSLPKEWRFVPSHPKDLIIGDPSKGILTDAAEIGNVEFLTLLTHSYPDLIWKINSDNYSIFHIAVIHRQEKVFSLIYRTGAIKDLLVLYVDKKGNNILHLAGKLPPPSRLNIVSGAALQMQRELLWFKEVKKIVPYSFLEMKNFDHKTPSELFSVEHNELREAGEEWMKDTASSCMVVAALIATVAFAAAFTVPGGNNDETGAPIFFKDRWFTVFVISDAVAMFSSTASIIMFLSILTSRYAEDDFLFTLPAKLMFGIISLFASIVCMVVTFSATFFLVYKEENKGTLPGLVAALALLPITLYAVLNCRLWISLIRSTCWSSRFDMVSTGFSNDRSYFYLYE